MSEPLKVGDVCLLVGTKHESGVECWPYLGAEVTLDKWCVIRKMWEIHAADGYEMRCEEKNLRKKKPPPEKTNWDEIYRLTNWRPNESATSHGNHGDI